MKGSLKNTELLFRSSTENIAVNSKPQEIHTAA